MDLLDDVLDTLDLRGVLYFRTDFAGPWAVTVPEAPEAARFHLVLQGQCVVAVSGGPTLTLGPGDLAMVPRGRSHVLADRAGRAPTALETVLKDAGYSGRGVLALGDGDPTASTQMVCGHYNFRDRARHPLLDALPDHILITAATRLKTPWLDELLRMMAQRALSDTLGSATSVKRLSEIVFAEVVRAGLAQSDDLARVMAGLQDPQIGRALAAIHAAPEEPWTVASLAAAVGMSRSSFAERFRELMGVAPLAYVTDWRIQRALKLLSDPRLSVQQVAGLVGYQSAAAFSRAFTAKLGVSPSEYRSSGA
ncbi:MAG: AraC family transcriptional regulator [Pseudomonadota bacterium]